MTKYIGLALIFITALLTGLTLTQRLSDRIKILHSIKNLLQGFKREISYQMPTLYELFYSSSEENLSQITNKIAELLNGGFSVRESVEIGFDKSPCISILSKDERNFIVNLLSSLGESDCESQISMIENSLAQIDYYIERAIEDKTKNSKVYLTTAVYIGLSIIIVLL